MLFQADTKLRQYSSNASAYATIDVETYLHNLVRVGIDVNGDGNVTAVEMLTALSNRLIYSPGMTQLPLWCQSAKVDSYCYEGFVDVDIIFNDALVNFNSTGNFDGSGE